jgi:multidrug resistance efflux pump
MTSSRRWVRPAITLGLAVLVGSIAGVGWLVHPGVRAGSASSAGSSPAAGEARVVCFGHVDVERGLTALYPVQPGRVQAVRVPEGASVHAGDVLLSLDRRLADGLVRQARAALADAEVRRNQAQRLLRRQPIREAEQQAVVEVAAARLRTAEAVLARRKELHNLAGSTKEEEAAAAQCDEARAALRGEQQRLEEIRLDDPHDAVARAEADVQARQAQLDQALLGLEQCDVKAPADGTILRVLVRPGEVLGGQPRQPAVWFCPKGPRIVRAEVDQEFAYRVAVGDAAVLHDDSGDGRSWRGRVTRLSDWYTHRRSILQDPLQFNDVRTLECLIALEPGQPPLRIGQRVLVTLTPAAGR